MPTKKWPCKWHGVCVCVGVIWLFLPVGWKLLSKNIIFDWQCPLLHLWTWDAKWTAWNSAIIFSYSSVAFVRFVWDLPHFSSRSLHGASGSLLLLWFFPSFTPAFLLLPHINKHSLSMHSCGSSLLLLSFSPQTPTHLNENEFTTTPNGKLWISNRLALDQCSTSVYCHLTKSIKRFTDRVHSPQFLAQWAVKTHVADGLICCCHCCRHHLLWSIALW